ncbi:MAG: hypothetical protein ACRDG4_05080, partial [Chloroflexota bacterium]
MSVRRLPVILLLLFAAIAPALGVARAARSMAEVGCAKQGYTMPVPDNWFIKGSCSSHAVIISNDKSILMTVKVTQHPFWTLEKARAAVAADLGGGGAPAPTFVRVGIGDRHYLEGKVYASDPAGTPEEYIEIITLRPGYVYRFFASLVLSTNPTATIIGPARGQSHNPRLPDTR